VTHSSTTGTTTIGDNFNFLIPIGVGVQPKGWPEILDFEFDPEVTPRTRTVTLLVHPGVILPLANGWAVGMRAAFEINQNSIGFTPLVNKSFPVAGHNFKWFVEGDLPLRFNRVNNVAPNPPTDSTSVAFVVHLGIAF
jgi:hypothetical protein